MAISLFVNERNDGLAFYINGDLQFDTTDEAVYHELLCIPTVALASQRFPHTQLRVLICGGGDGLAAKQVLRFPQICQVDLVDYSSEVLELAKTVFQLFNDSSLTSPRLKVITEEAFNFLSQIPDSYYHVVICDFTYPKTADDTKIHSYEWYQQVERVLIPNGTVSVNGVSPQVTASGFWCLYQTMLAAGLKTKPLQVEIPSFVRHHHGTWGFFIGSSFSVTRSEVEAICLPKGLQYLTLERLLDAFTFDAAIAQSRHNLVINTLECPQLFYYLLNSNTNKNTREIGKIDFLDIVETGTAQKGTTNPLSLFTVSQTWLALLPLSLQVIQGAACDSAEASQLLPVQHMNHTQQMTTQWLSHTQKLVGAIDLSRLAKALEARTHLQTQTQTLTASIQSKNQPIQKMDFGTTIFICLAVVLLFAGFSSPDSGYGKGSTGTSLPQINNQIDPDKSRNKTTGFSRVQIFGFILSFCGAIWILMLLVEYFNRGK